MKLGDVDRDRLEAMAAAGEEVLECHRVLAKTKDNVVGEVLRGQGTFYEWNHYPKGDVYDHETHSQYYYHAHPSGSRDIKEHGHFHTFLRPKGMPDAVAPAPLADLKLPDGANDALSHLIAISMDSAGFPLRLFTTNRWVTGEIWYTAGDVAAMLDNFLIDHTRPSWPTNRWITGMLAMFYPQIVALLEERDAAVAKWQKKNAGDNAFEDRRLEVTSLLEVSLDKQMRAIERALNGKG